MRNHIKPDPEFIRKRVEKYYDEDQLNCTVTTLNVMAEVFNMDIHPQVLAAATGMHGAGKYGAQCGLVEGMLMFIGILGKKHGVSDDIIIKMCNDFAAQFESQFGSLLCRILRPEGFSEDQPPGICNPLTCNVLAFDIQFLHDNHNHLDL